MKSPNSMLEKLLDELADGLDAGWDAPEEPAAPSLTPHSAPLPVGLDALDAEWDVAAPPVAPPAPAKAPPVAESALGAPPLVAVPVPERSAQPRSSAVRLSSPTRPDPTRALAPPVAPSTTPLWVSKKDRREAERKRRAHETQRKSAQKKQRKADRRAQALRTAEQNRSAEERALAERQAREQANPGPKRTQGKAADTDDERASGLKRPAKQVRHEHPRRAHSAATERRAAAKEKSKPVPLVMERGAKKLILPFLIALLVAVTLGFALSRAQ